MRQPHQSTTTESASLGSVRHHITAAIALLIAALMAVLGVTASVNGATAVPNTNVLTPSVKLALVSTPSEMRVRSLMSTANEKKRQVRLNRVAKKKHQVRVVRNKIIKTAKAQIGDAYRAGHSGPNAFDCSGLVRYVFKQVTGKTLPHYSKAQYKQARKIKKSEALPGDLVFFFEKGAHHVGIYIGNGKMIDAPRVGEKVRISPISGSWWGRSYTGMGRVLPA